MVVPDYARRILGAFPDAAILVTAPGTVLAANAPARKALGVTATKPMDLALADVVVAGDEGLTAKLRSWARSTEPLPGSFTLNGASGPAVFNCQGCVIIPHTDSSPAVLLVRFWPREEANPFLLLSQKIVELNDEVARRKEVEDALRRSEAALRERALEAESLNRAKDEFLATVSHELRTPLHAIVGWSSLLRGRGKDPTVEKALEVIFRNAESQSRIIDDILDVSRIVSGKLRLETERVDLVAIAQDAVEVIRPSAAAKEIAITLVPPARTCSMIADPERIRQVIWNLLSNAVKFTERRGAIRIEIGQRASQVTLQVTDTGIGIDPDFLPLVFDRFKQADSSTTRRVGGLGLGLALVRHIVELHGGSAHASSEGHGRGATFEISLPTRAVVPAEKSSAELVADDAEAPAVASTAALDGIRVLVIDDEPDARELLESVLAGAGAAVETAASAREGLTRITPFAPHVLVSDIGMPDEDGYVFIGWVRARSADEGGAVPAIALTAYARPEDRAQAVAAGFTTHLGKPVHPTELVSAIATLSMLTKG